MINILFICHGNICRSTMAQFVFQDMVNKAGLSDRFHIDSAATSREEIGNPPHHGTVRKMQEVGVPVLPHRARQMTKKDYQTYDYLIGMDAWNIRNMQRIAGGDPDGRICMLLDFTDRAQRIAGGDPDGRICMLLDFTDRAGEEIADPWYTGNFDVTYRDVKEGCEGLLNRLTAQIY